MNEIAARYSVLKQSADAHVAAAIEALVQEAPDHQLNRINVLEFAREHGFGEEQAIGAFLHATRLGLFDMSWNVLCPGCGGVLDTNASLKTFTHDTCHCALCAAGYEPSLDETVEVSFTVSPRVRRIGAHDPDTLPIWDYTRQVFWSSGIAFPDDATFKAALDRIVLDAVELAAGEKIILSLQLPEAFLIIFDPVTHAAQFLTVKGEATDERQQLTLVFNNVRAPTGTMELRPGPLRLTLDNRAGRRVLPAVWIAGDELHDLLGHRRPFLTAKRLLTNQTFHDIYRADTLDIDQRLKLTSLTFLFTDLKGSTALYDRVGDLVAYDLVKAHFSVITTIVAEETGCVVKTIGDAIMATFPSPDRALAAALRMREAMRTLADGGADDLILKIGLHEGPCLAVTLNDRLDYFGQTVNIAARVQGLAMSRAIFATETILGHPEAPQLIAGAGLSAAPQRHALRGIPGELTVYEIA